MPRLLYTYLITELLAPFFASLVILIGVLFLGRLIPFLNIIFAFNVNFADFVRLCAYIIPNLLLFALPMASMTGVILAFTKLANDNEIMALKTGGIGLYRMLPPVMIFALFTAALTLLTSIHLLPAGTVAMKKMMFQLAKEKIDKGFQEKQFNEGLGDVVLYVDRIDRDNNAWQGVYAVDTRDRDNPLTIIARFGTLSANPRDMLLTLSLSEGTMHRSVGDLTQTLRFDSYTLELPMGLSENGMASVGKKGLSMATLRKQALQGGAKTLWGILRLIEYHMRLVLPFGCFILSVLAVPLSLQSRPGSRPIGLPLGLGFFIFYYVLITAAKAVSENGVLPVGLVMWVPNILAAILTVYLVRAVAAETPSKLLEYPVLAWQKIISFLPGARRRPGQ